MKQSKEEKLQARLDIGLEAMGLELEKILAASKSSEKPLDGHTARTLGDYTSLLSRALDALEQAKRLSAVASASPEGADEKYKAWAQAEVQRMRVSEVVHSESEQLEEQLAELSPRVRAAQSQLKLKEPEDMSPTSLSVRPNQRVQA